MVKRSKTYCFIDASNLFYGGEKSLGWKIDYHKLANYLKSHYQVSAIHYYGGVELNGYRFSVLDKHPLNLEGLIAHLRRKLNDKNCLKRKLSLSASISSGPSSTTS